MANDVGPVGGMERQLTELILGLVGRGANVTLVARSCHLSHPGLNWVKVPGPTRPFVIAFPWFWVIGSIFAARSRADVLHTTGAIVANRTDVATVHFVHAANGLTGIRRGISPRALYARAARWIGRYSERRAYRSAVTKDLVAVSAGVATELRENGLGVGCAIHVIPNAVDADCFRPDLERRERVRRELGIGPTDLLAAFVGGDWERKGLRFAVRALGKATRWTLVVAGEGDTASMFRMADRIGVRDRLRYVGITQRPEEIYAAADAFVMPTGYESFGLAVYEAAACGLPLLVCRTNGIEEILDHGVNGWFIDRDAEGIAERLGELAARPALRRAMAAASREKAQGRSWNEVVDRYVALYKQIIECSPIGS